MTAFEIQYNQQDLPVLPGQSLLDAALAQQLTLPNSCRSGICQTCLVKVKTGPIPPEAQIGLSENQIQQNLALACQLRPTTFIAVSDTQSSDRHEATVISHELLTSDVLRLRLQSDIQWNPGQYLTLWKKPSVGRPYSIASLPSDNFLEFHIKRHSQGDVSQWLHDELNVGDKLSISEARGNCFYHPSMQQKPLLLIGAGTGLAPLYGVIQNALSANHPARIDLLLTNSQKKHTYLHDDLRQLVQQYPNFYFQSILRGEQCPGFITNDIATVVNQDYPSLQHWCVFICGAPTLVQQLQKLCFLRGASLGNIYTDPFISTPPTE